MFVCGSTHEPEESLLLDAWRTSVPETRLILVPRHPGRARVVAEAFAALGLAPQRLTALRDGRERPDPTRPVIVDTIGDLEGIYSLADLVFVGGSLVPHGGQNMLEPAAGGRATLYGPHVDNFRQEAELLESAGASVRRSPRAATAAPSSAVTARACSPRARSSRPSSALTKGELFTAATRRR